MTPHISFIFVNYHSAALLGRSLNALRAVADVQGQMEYIVINNDISERAPLDQIVTQHPDLKIFHQERNAGFGSANNVGARRATGEILFFINPDTVLRRGSFTGLVAAFHFRPLAVYGMALVQRNGEREPWSAGGFPSLGRAVLAHIVPGILRKPWRATVVESVDWVSGAALVIRREFFQSLGGFDERFFLYFEDVDLARRAHEFGGWVGLYPFVVLQHAGGRSHANGRAKKLAYYAGQRRYFKKWRPWYETAVMTLGHRAFRYF